MWERLSVYDLKSRFSKKTDKVDCVKIENCHITKKNTKSKIK